MADAPKDKAELMKRIDERWARFQGLVSGLSSGDVERPLGDGYSAKVHLAHLTAWEQSLMAMLRKEDRVAAIGVSREMWDDTDTVNAVIARRAEGKTADEVASEADATHAELVRVLDGMSDDDLERPYSDYQPDDPPYNAKPAIGWVHGNTWEHYEEHIGWLEAGLREAVGG